MILTTLVPDSGTRFDLDGKGLEALEELYRCPDSPWLRLNFVASVNGDAVGPDGTSESLSSRTDRKILGVIRRSCDLVLVGAQSVRTEGYFLPKTAPLAILTSTGDLTGHRIPHDVAEGRVVILCPPAAVAKTRATVAAKNVDIVAVGPDATASASWGAIDIRTVVSTLRERGYANIVCEGGPTLAGSLVTAGVVNELCLTTSPQITATNRPFLSRAANHHAVRLEQLLADEEGFLFARWLITN